MARREGAGTGAHKARKSEDAYVGGTARVKHAQTLHSSALMIASLRYAPTRRVRR